MVCDAVLIIGNGFDKNCGLKTGYTDVYDEYINSPSKSTNIADFKHSISSDYENWSDFEFGMSKYAMRFDAEEPFIECLSDFNRFMHEYLSRVQSEFYKKTQEMNIRESMREEFYKSFKALGKGVTHNISNSMHSIGIPNISSMGFITLNYTTIFDSILKLTYGHQYPLEPIHIHGRLGDDTVLGMDREEQLTVSFGITDKVKRHFLKPVFNEEYDSSRVANAKDLITDAKVIFVYGASLGDSDLSWRELLGEWLLKDENHHLFLYCHRNSKRSFDTVSDRLDYEIEEKERNITKWNGIGMDVLKKQMHFPCGINLFDIETAVVSVRNL